MKILFDAMGAQVQVQQATGDRLTTWFDSLSGLGYDHAVSNPADTLSSQLAGVNVYVSLTRQRANPTRMPPGVDFSYTPGDLYALQQWVRGGGSVLMFTNHSGFPEAPSNKAPLWPIFEVQLAASLGIQLVFATFAPAGGSPTVPTPCSGSHMLTLSMAPAGGAPAQLVAGVSQVQAWDSGGIVPGGGTAVIALPPAADCTDRSGLGYAPDGCAFAALYTFGAGKVIVVGHSGIAANDGTCLPSPGQIGAADNRAFLDNCITYLGS
jgi:hypothetical protein